MEKFYQQFIREKLYLHNVSSRTVEGYGWAWQAFEPALSGRSCLQKAELMQRVEELRAKGLSPVTVNTYLRSINAFCAWLNKEGHIPSPLRIPRLKEQQYILPTFSQEQVTRLVAYRPTTLTERRIQLLACLILDTGLRIDEALSINRQADLDLDQATVTVRNGKGGKGRVVPISQHMRRLLFKFIQGQAPEYGSLLFFANAGERLVQRNALRDFKHLCRKLGIIDVRCSFHTLRHSFALAYIQNGGDVFRLQRILGHSKLEMTRRYVNLSLGDLQQVHQRFSLLANVRH